MNDRPDKSLRSTELLSRGNSRLLIVDMQQKLLPLIPVADRVIRNCRRLIEGAGILSVPVFATEQYPKGLGGTVPELAELLAGIPSKVRFSCTEVLNWGAAAEQADDRDQVVVAGIEWTLQLSARRIGDSILAAAAEQAGCNWIATFDEAFASPTVPSRLL